MKYIIIILSLIIVFSCEKQTEWDLDNNNDEVIVIDGLLTNENKQHEVRISYLSNELNEEPQPVRNAFVTISNGDSIVYLNHSLDEPGLYKTPRLIAPYDNTYTLNVRHKGKHYSASATPVSVYPDLRIRNRISLDNLGENHGININTQWSLSEAAMYHIDLDWSYTDYCENTDDCGALLKYYALNTIDINQVFTMEKEDVTFPDSTTLIVTKYSMTNKHEAYIRTLLSETQWKGGYFDVESANLATNIEGGALGFFAVCMFYTDTFQVYRDTVISFSDL